MAGVGRDVIGDDLIGNAPQVEALAAGYDGRQDLLRLCGRKDEFYVLGRLLQGLQKCVEGLVRKHVNLINDIDFEFTILRWVSNLVNKISYIVN